MEYYKFGNLKVIIDGADEYFEKIAMYYEVLPFSDYDIKISISKTDAVAVPSCEKIGSVPLSLAEVFWFTDNENTYMAGYNAPTDEYIFCGKIDKEYKNIEIDLLNLKTNEDTSFVIRNVLDFIMRFVVIKHNCINIHSSAIAYNKNGILFSAPSGTGKSTHTALWQEAYPETLVINDDLPLITVGDEVLISGTPWCGTSGVNENVTVPLKAIVFLRRGEQNEIEKINPMMALRYLVTEVFSSPVAEITDLQFDLIGKILAKVPTYLLKCNISQEAVKTVKKECGI